jgi:DNA-binding response OmpR family regulator
MTGYSATIDERKAREIGIRAYLHKPVRGDELLAAVASAIERKSAA